LLRKACEASNEQAVIADIRSEEDTALAISIQLAFLAQTFRRARRQQRADPALPTLLYSGTFYHRRAETRCNDSVAFNVCPQSEPIVDISVRRPKHALIRIRYDSRG